MAAARGVQMSAAQAARTTEVTLSRRVHQAAPPPRRRCAARCVSARACAA